MEEVTSKVTIAVMMDYLACHEIEYLCREKSKSGDFLLRGGIGTGSG